MIFKDYYKILEFDTNKVSMAQIKVAYRDLAKKYHPDVNLGNSNAEERFKDINEAYKVLSDQTAKRKYDRIWNINVGRKIKKEKSYAENKRTKDTMFKDFFNMFFGGTDVEENREEKVKGKPPIKGENVETEINVSIEEAFNGKEKNISLRTVKGKMTTFSVKIPAGIRNNERIRLIGQGKKGENGGKNGDLFIKIKINNDEKLRLDGIDLKTDIYITPWEAALSTKVNLQALGENLTVYIPAGMQSGEKIRIPNKGYKDGKGGRGDLIAETKIMIPKELSQDEKNLFKQMSQISKFNPRES